jgi:CRISPR-associated Csx2 family protein
MNKVFLSFLGATDYIPCTYFRENVGEVNNVRFVQQAMISLFCKHWTKNDRICIFTTNIAETKNWNDNGHVRRYASECKGLKSCIEQLSLNADVNNIPIPEGKNENEIWEVFQIIFNSINTNDEVIFDITHAFRSIPMLAIVVLNYAKVLKKINLKEIFYGAFETLENPAEVGNIPLEKRRVPIIELTTFDKLMDWTIGIDRYIETGNAGMLSSLALSGIQPILKATKGKDKSAATIGALSRQLNIFASTIATCRGKKIPEAASDLKRTVERSGKLSLLPPFIPIFERLKQQLQMFSGELVSDGVQAAKWCYKHNMIQQAYTILQETLISHFTAAIGENPMDMKVRKIASQAVTICATSKPENGWMKEAAENKEITHKFLRFFHSKPERVKLMRNLSKDRNDLNHAGYKSNPMSAEKFEKKFSEMLNHVKAIPVGKKTAG